MQKRFLSSPHVGLLLLVILMAAAPVFVQNEFIYGLFIRICLTATAVVGLSLLAGYAGQISLGHAAFYGAGAYGCAILAGRYGLPPVVSLLLTAVAVAVIAWVVNRPILHLRGLYLAVATLGLGIIFTIVLNNESQFTGGPDGTGVPALSVLGHELSVFGEYHLMGMTMSGVFVWYVLSCVVLLAAVWIALNIIDSPMGRALRALHGSEIAAEMAGVDIAKFKLKVFVISAVYASVAGGLYGYYSGFVTPDIASFDHSVELLIMVVLGGMASIYGGIIGTAILLLIPQFLTGLQELEVVLYGVILMLVMIFLPRGLLPSVLHYIRRGAA